MELELVAKKIMRSRDIKYIRKNVLNSHKKIIGFKEEHKDLDYENKSRRYFIK